VDGNFVMPYAQLHNKPRGFGRIVVAQLRDTTQVTLVEVDTDWCNVQEVDEARQEVQGWMTCHLLLDYQPTPVPLSRLTPVFPFRP
jgi:hypothetical protein